jgi:hypothetical protein
MPPARNGNTKLKRSDMAEDIVVEQPDEKNPDDMTDAHLMSSPVVRPSVTATPPAPFRFYQDDAEKNIHELLLRVRKAGSVFWVGVAVPEDTADFTRAQVWFHPTVVQNGRTLADDKDYPDFKGGWPGDDGVQRYVALQGVQLAAAGLRMPLLVPFTTMAAIKAGGATNQNMFFDRPVETLNAIMAAVWLAIKPGVSGDPALAAIGAASFSSGITALKIFLAAMPSGLVQEVIDFDSPFIVQERNMLTSSPPAVSKCFTQVPPVRPQVGYVTVTEKHFQRVTAYTDIVAKYRLHGRIGRMMYQSAMMNSVFRP